VSSSDRSQEGTCNLSDPKANRPIQWIGLRAYFSLLADLSCTQSASYGLLK